jgi:dTDP-glucose 4,6-dehydratase
MRKKILLTGSCGFIFSSFLRYVIDHMDYDIVSIDKLVDHTNVLNVLQGYEPYIGDITDPHFVNRVFEQEKPDIIIHAAAESHVDASIESALVFIHANVVGTQVMIDNSIKYGVERFVYISTDEVMGHHTSTLTSGWIENAPTNPRNPYSSSKMAGELLVKAAHETHGLAYNITRSCNNYGERQPPRNLVPRIITSLMSGQNIPIHGNGLNMREWIYVEDKCTAILKIIEEAPLNEIYNIGTGLELQNIHMVNNIAEFMNITPKIEYVKDRAGHDYRYLVDSTKIRSLGWKPKYSFEDGMKKSIKWYMDNKKRYIGKESK